MRTTLSKVFLAWRVFNSLRAKNLDQDSKASWQPTSDHRWIPGLENLYSVTIDGRIFSHREEPFKLLPLSFNDSGHLIVRIYALNAMSDMAVSEAVALAFVGDPPARSVGQPTPITYRDGNPLNCHASNVRYDVGRKPRLKHRRNRNVVEKLSRLQLEALHKHYLNRSTGKRYCNERLHDPTAYLGRDDGKGIDDKFIKRHFIAKVHSGPLGLSIRSFYFRLKAEAQEPQAPQTRQTPKGD